jgi:NtrC-family two-component system sensor histidine kinase KinB
MRLRSLRTRFLLAGGLLVAATVASGAWSVLTFARLSAAVGEVLQNSRERIGLTATLAGTLEREDDALLRSLAGEAEPANGELARERQRFEDAFDQLQGLLAEPDERAAAAALRGHVDAYRKAGDALRETQQRDAARFYLARVNPALREAVADCGHLRELDFRAMRQADARVREQAGRSSIVVAALSLAALACSALVAVRLARAVLGPVRELTRGVEAIRGDDFEHRVRAASADELGRLADGFNRMADALAEYRHSSLGELLLAKTTLESTLAVLPDAVIVVGPDGDIVSKNALAVQVLRSAGGEGAGRVQDLPLPGAVLRAVEDVLRGQRGGARPDLSQALSVRVDGRPLKMLATVAPIPDFLPRRRGAVLVLADVTDFARLDELRGELVAVASHELKTPLTALRMNLLLLQERADDLTARQREILAAAVGGAEELAGTIDELLDLTRIEAGQLRLQRERVDMDALAEQAAAALRPRFEDADVRLRVVHDAPAAAVRGDAARLRIVFANLLDNALKYTPPGGEVSVRLAPAPGAARLQLSVTDTGPGVPPEHRERVFEKFFRVEHDRDGGPEGVRGAGIGLYLCRQIVEAHGGSIRCEAGEGGRGARITILLETEDAAAPGELPARPGFVRPSL